MKRVFLITAVLLAMALSFLAGWRVMPKVWPGIKENVVYRIAPDMKPTPAPTQEPYHPEGSAFIGDEISVSDSLVYYLYKPQCSYCRSIGPYIKGLPETVLLSDGSISAVKLIPVNKQSDEGAALAEAYYAENSIPLERQLVPAVIIGGSYFVTGSEIMTELTGALLSGEGIKTPLLEGGDRK